MMCYRDRTFCKFYKDCTKGDKCDSILTEKVKQDAVKWWGGEDPPIAVYLSEPLCFENIGKGTGTASSLTAW